MNPRSVINFFKSPPGAFLGFCVILGVIFFGVKRFLPGATKPHPLVYSTKAAATAASKETLETYQNTNYVPVKISVPPAAPAALVGTTAADTTPRLEIPPKRMPVKAAPKPEILPISLFSETPKPKPKSLSKDYAPYGRLIPCELIVTVDSSSIQTPIIGFVTEDVYFGGRLLIPAGTEVHGKAQTDRSRERIASSGGWTFVWQDGRELRVSGIALDREFDPNGTGWGITDGSAGLRGQILKSDDMAEIKLFAASFLSAAASAFTENQQTIYGTQVLPTAQNAGLEGAQSVIQAYAQQIYDSIQRDGFYVRVPAGKQFYLYVTQTIDISDATVGGTRFLPNEFESQTNQMPNALAPYLSPAAAAYLNRSSP
jgi:Bacterial conjugation TrbI-like protein